MRCSKCGAENPDRAKFCEECATPLARRCQSCGSENSPTAKFCIECAKPFDSAGKSQPAPAPANSSIEISVETGDASLDGERKTVTALFADIKGSTELEQDLDPEEARAIVDPALKLMIEAVQRYGGYIVQSTGDGIFALFGAPVAHEDHPQRALYAALRMQDELRRYGDRLLVDGRAPLEIRIGANTGEVVVRSILTGGKTEYTPIGHTTNLASRMQALAPTGSIAISEETRKLVEGYFALKPRGPTRVKGIAEPVNLYEVIGLGPLRTRLQRSAAHGYTKFVGRQREMEAMRHAAELAHSGHGQIVAAVAEAGVGKSRLFFEFKAKNQSGWMVLEAFSVSHGKASAYLPVLDLLHSYFDIKSEDDARKRREKVNGRILTLDRALEDTLPYLFALLRIVEGEDPLAQMDANIRKRRTLDAIKRILLRESLNRPLMVIFEDLHWIDDETQELLNLLADSIATAKILLLVNYRPEYSHQWGSKTHYTQLRLDPLSKESAEEMLSALLGDGIELAPLKRLLIEKTEGNPFFMEEIFQSLLEDGSLRRNGTVKLMRAVEQLKLPPTVQGILASRIDRLPTDEKDLLQTLAVIGKEFPRALVKELTGRAEDELERMLGTLQLGEFIYEQPAVGGLEYTFKHTLTQEVVYNSVLMERRKLLHERAAQAVEVLFRERLDDHVNELAHHYSRSTNVQKAVDYLQRAGEQAAQRSAYTDAITHLSTALALLKTLPEAAERSAQELALLITLGTPLVATRGYADPEVERVYIQARELCRQVGETLQLFPVLSGLHVHYLTRGEHRTALELAEQLLRQAQRQSDNALLVQAYQAMGFTSFARGEFVRARTHLERSIALYDPRRHRSYVLLYQLDPQVHCLFWRGWVLWYLGYPAQALESVDEALIAARELSHPFSLAGALIGSALLQQLRREGQSVQERAEAAITIATERGFALWLAFGAILRGWALAERGNGEEGIAQLREGLAAKRAIGAGVWGPASLALLAEAYGSARNPEEGLVVLAEALAMVDKTGERNYAAEIHRLKGQLLLIKDLSNAAEADRCFRTAIEIAQEQSAKSLELRAATSLARLLRDTNRRDEARAMLSEIYNWFTEGFDLPDLKDAKALLEELSDKEA